MAQTDLSNAKNVKKNEFYTMYEDIQREVNAYLDYDPDTFKDKVVLLPCDDPEWSNFTKFFVANFKRLGLKKLISTSYAIDSKVKNYQMSIFDFISDFEKKSPQYNENITKQKGKIFILDRSTSKKIDIDNLQWSYLEGDGDFRSDEVKKLRDEAQIIVTNPPFTLFRDFIKWIFEEKNKDGKDKQFLIIGNQNAITYKDVFPLIMENRMWLGYRFNERVNGENMIFRVPDSYPMIGTEVFTDDDGKKFISVSGTGWFTNLDHGRRHSPLQGTMTMKDNIKFNKEFQNKIKKDGLKEPYQKYDNYEAIEVSVTSAIPSDYSGVMGVPISFLPKYCPTEFEILGATQRGCHDLLPDTKKYDDFKEINYKTGKPTGSSGGKTNENANLVKNDGKHNYFINDSGEIIQSGYQRIFIRRKES